MEREEGLVRFLASLALDGCKDDLEVVVGGEGNVGGESRGQREP